MICLIQSYSHYIFATEDFIYAIRGRIESYEDEVSKIDINIIYLLFTISKVINMEYFNDSNDGKQQFFWYHLILIVIMQLKISSMQ